MSLTIQEKIALQQLEDERNRRMVERLEKGVARLLPPLVVCSADTPREPDPDGVYRGHLLPEGVIERKDFIATGVPRTGREFPISESEWHSRPPFVTVPDRQPHKPGDRIAHREPDGPWIDVHTSIAGKSESDPGRIIQGSYRHKAGNCIEVRSEDRKSVVHPVGPNDDVESFVRKQLRLQYK